MKQARKDGMTLLQRLGTDAHFAYNCSVQDLTPRCMHWVSVLGNLVLPSIKRTREEIRTGRVRQYKARICIVAWDTNIPNQQIVVDEQVLVWYRNRFYRANQFCAIYAQFDPRERFPCLSTADEPFTSEAITSHQVYLDFVDYVANQIQTTTGATSTQGGSRAIPKARQPDPNYNRSVDLGTDLIRDPPMATPSRSGTTTTTSGPTTSGRSGVGATRGGSTEMTTAATIAESQRLAEAMAFCSIFSARGLMTSIA